MVDMLSLKWKPLHRNDVIVAEIRGSDKICKRIVGLPGDTIHVHGAWFAQKVRETEGESRMGVVARCPSLPLQGLLEMEVNCVCKVILLSFC